MITFAIDGEIVQFPIVSRERVMIWPAPKSFSKVLPTHGQPGSFWEDRGDRRHCGVDLYAPFGSRVLSAAAGEVVEVGVFTSPQQTAYWNETHYVVIRHDSSLYVIYAELHDRYVGRGDSVGEGELVGSVGCVLDLDKIDASSPPYIQRLKTVGAASMLHLECRQTLPSKSRFYRGGNWFAHDLPSGLLDPTTVLFGQ